MFESVWPRGLENKKHVLWKKDGKTRVYLNKEHWLLENWDRVQLFSKIPTHYNDTKVAYFGPVQGSTQDEVKVVVIESHDSRRVGATYTMSCKIFCEEYTRDPFSENVHLPRKRLYLGILLEKDELLVVSERPYPYEDNSDWYGHERPVILLEDNVWESPNKSRRNYILVTDDEQTE